MKRKSYPKYINSGVEWLGEVPEHWGKVSLKWASIRYSGGTPDKTIQEYWDDGSIPWLNSGAVNDGYITEPSEYITEEAFRNSSAKWIPKEALVMALAGQGKTKGMVAQLGFKTTCNQSMAAIIPDQRFCARMLFWWLTKNYINLRNLAGGEARDGLNLEMIGSIPCPLPPLPEQQAIAAFLDHESAKIDTLIGKKKKLVELLKEKRTAIISQAVTKGLDISVKMKPSGVEWLGDVPEHWRVKRLKSIGFFKAGAGFPDDEQGNEDEEIPFFKVSDMTNDGNDIYMYKSNNTVSRNTARRLGAYIFKKKTVIFAKVGAALLLNRRRIIEHDSCIDNNIMGYVIKAANYKYIYYWLSPIDFGRLSNPGAVPSINDSQLREIPIALPPLPEQQTIASFLDRETAKIDTLVSKVETAIGKLKEYRTALISTAVTGKIDVREAV